MSNEYITEAGLNWLDFHNRQYDPQTGRFLGVDPLAEETDIMSPYVAMNNDPVLNIDPLGLQGMNTMDRQGARDNFINPFAEFYSRFSRGTLKAWGMTGSSQWGAGACDAIKQAMAEEKTKSLYDMIGEAMKNPGTVVTNFGVAEQDILFLGTDENNNKLYYYVLAKTTGVYSQNGYDPTAKEEKKSSTISDISSIIANGTFIASNAISFVAETKPGKYLSMGGFAFKQSVFSVQKGLIKDFAGNLPKIKGAGNILGGIGIGLTLYDMKVNGVTTSNSLDLVMGGVSFVPGVGWVIGGIYFIGNTALKGTTGMDLGEHMDDFKRSSRYQCPIIGVGALD